MDIYIFCKIKDDILMIEFLSEKQVGGPSWTVKLGRRDSTTASLTLAERELPTAADSLDKLISNFAGKGLTARDMVALSG
jgi:peroxidase